MKCYIDDFKKIRVYSEKPLSDEKIKELFFFENEDKLKIKLVDLEVSKDFFKYEFVLENEIDFSKSYYLIFDRQRISASMRYICQTKKFEDTFFYQENDLGANYQKEKTTFKLWAPTAKEVFLKLPDLDLSLKMNRNHSNFELTVFQDLELQKYLYHIIHQDSEVITIDPYSYATTKNAKESVVLNPANFIHEKYQPTTKINSNVDASIYEISVRDLTVHKSSGVKNKAKLEGLLETDTSYFNYPTAYNYIKNLGISHVQIMPVFDFASYDEDAYFENYNWGYDPLQYSTIEGSYLKNDSPYNRVNVLRKLVNQFHKDDIRVNLDVVFNHVYDTQSFSWEKIVPYYSFRYNEDDSYSNGSFCGNEIRSEALMIRKYIIDMCKRYVDIFDIDGLRFDLMGLLDIETMNQLYKTLSQLKKDFMIYGEGWDMPTTLAHEHRAINYHNYQMPNIGFFNNVYRDILKGGTMMDAIKDVGYVLGDLNKFNQAINLILGSSLDGSFKSNTQSVNYFACHDNMTFYDKMSTCLYVDEYTKKQRAKLALGVLLISQGIPFIHCGQEFLRTKDGHDNTYNMPDNINAVNWFLTIKNADVVESFKKILKFRKENPEFRLTSNEDISKIKVSRYFDVMVIETTSYLCFINTSDKDYQYNFENDLCYVYGETYLENTMLRQINLKAISLNIVKK